MTASTGVSALTRFANSRIHQNHADDGRRVALKVVLDGGRSAIASTNRTDDEALRRLVASALEAAALRPPDPDFPGLAPHAPAPAIDHYDAATAAADPDLRASIVKSFVDEGPGLDAAGICSTDARELAFANSEGQRLSGRSTAATVSGIHRTSESDGSGRGSSARVSELDGATAGRTAAAKARAGDGAIDVEPGRYEVVLEPACLANMLQFLGSAGFNARSVDEGTSFALVGNQQFDVSVSIWDDATDPRTLGLPFDSEGTPKRRVDLVRQGVTTGLVHNRRTAAAADVESTGHGGFAEAFGPVPTNVFFGVGAASRDELVASVKRGLLVTEFNYTRILDPKTQVVTGLTRNGTFLVESGRIVAPVKNLRFTQSYVAALGPGNVLGIGSDAELIGSSYVPSLHLASWNFTGGARG